MTIINTLNTWTYTQNFWWVDIYWTQTCFSRNMYEAMVWAAQIDFSVDFWDGLKLQDWVWNQELLLECDIDNLDRLIHDIHKRFSLASNKYNSNSIDSVRQVWEYAGSFRYEGKWYIILFPRNWLTDETLLEKGIYKWIIVNPELYFSDEAQDQVDDWADAAKRILDWE